MRRLFILSSLLFLLGADAGRAAALAKANRLLESAYEAIVASHPTSGRARLGLAIALGEVSHCDRALALFSELRGRRVWSAPAALSEGKCHLMRGDRSSAYAAFEEAYFMDISIATSLHMVYVRAEEEHPDALAEVLDELALLDDGTVEAFVRADLALRSGAPEVDALLAEANHGYGGELPPGLAVLEARRWMDVDHPAEAAGVLLASLRRHMSHLQSAIWRAEALRRAGQLADADSALSRPIIRQANEVPLGRSVRARMAVDAGELEVAAEIVSALPLDEHGVATRWYLARAQGDEEAMQWLASRWSEMSGARDRSLEQLVPIHARTAP